MLHEGLERIPDESLEYHARRNHFSIWLRARTEFELAEETLRVEISGRAYALREGADVEVRGGGGEIALVGEQG